MIKISLLVVMTMPLPLSNLIIEDSDYSLMDAMSWHHRLYQVLRKVDCELPFRPSKINNERIIVKNKSPSVVVNETYRSETRTFVNGIIVASRYFFIRIIGMHRPSIEMSSRKRKIFFYRLNDICY